MDVIKTELRPNVYKLILGTSYDSTTKTMQGTSELDIESQGHFIEMVNAIFDTPCMSVIVDMRYISYIDSSGLWALFEGHKKASQLEGRLALVQPTRDVRRVLDITKMSSKVSIFDSEEEALSEFELTV